MRRMRRVEQETTWEDVPTIHGAFRDDLHVTEQKVTPTMSGTDKILSLYSYPTAVSLPSGRSRVFAQDSPEDIYWKWKKWSVASWNPQTSSNASNPVLSSFNTLEQRHSGKHATSNNGETR